jgi:acetyl-CoA carboxylase biotin carboxylase subunit
VWGADRATAIARSRVALAELVVDGLETNIPFHRALLRDKSFLDGVFTTNLIDRRGAASFLPPADEQA